MTRLLVVKVPSYDFMTGVEPPVNAVEIDPIQDALSQHTNPTPSCDRTPPLGVHSAGCVSLSKTSLFRT